MTLYSQVAGNRRKTWIFLIIYSFLLLGIGYAVGLYYQSSFIVAVAAVLAIGQGVAGYWFSDQIALAVSGAEPLDPKRYASVYTLVENLCITAGIPRPTLYLIPDQAMNAFATGRDPKHASLAVTQGLLERLDKNELQGVLAHELSHVRNEDIRLMSLVMILGGTIALISDIFLKSLWFGDNRRDDNSNSGIMLVVAIVLSLLAPLAATMIQLAISRKREFMADADGVLLTRYPAGLISALRKIESDDQPLEAANKATAHLYFSSPLHDKVWLAGLFDTHPPIEERIKALEKGSGTG